MALICFGAAFGLCYQPNIRGRAQFISYTITDLGTLDGPNGVHSKAYSINNCGSVVGVSWPAGTSSDHPFFWRDDNANNQTDPGEMKDLASLNGGTARAINSYGYVVGRAGGPPALWHDDNGNGVVDSAELINLFPGVLGEAEDINNAGRVVGTVDVSGGSSIAENAFVWDKVAGPQILSASNGITPLSASGINDAGTIVGQTATFHAFVFLNGGLMIDLGTLGGARSNAFKVGSGDYVVGFSELPSCCAAVPLRAFLWHDDNGNGVRDAGPGFDEMKDLGVLGGIRSIAYGVNGSRNVVGSSEIDSSGLIHAFIWRDDDGGGPNPGVMTDLNSLIDQNSGWTLEEADSISDGGQIVGYGTISSKTHAFLLTPVGFAASQCTLAPTTVSASGSGIYNAPATVTATLSSAIGPVSGKTINFTVDGVAVCGSGILPACPTTNASGIATLNLSGINAGSHALVATFAADSGFAGSNNTGTLIVNQANATITLDNPTFVYDGSAKSATPTTNPAGLTGVSITYNLSGTPPTNAASYSVVATLTNANYQALPANSTLTINPASSTTVVSIGNVNVAYDGLPHGATATVTGAGGLNQNLAVTYTGRNGTVYLNSPIAPISAGDYTAFASFSDTNHTLSSHSKDFQITKTNQSITFGLLTNKTFGDADFSVSATATSGLAVSFVATSDQCTILNTSTVHITGAGTCTVTASQLGNTNYNAAADVPRLFAINKASQTITFGTLSTKTLGEVPFTVSATGGASGNPVTFGATGGCTSGGTNGDTITITGVGSCMVTASQLGNTNYNAAPNIPQSFNISCGASDVVTNTKDGGAGSLRNAISSACPGDTITFNIPINDPGLSGGIYTIALTSAELAINKNLTVTGVGASALRISRSSIFGTPLMRIFDISAGNTVNFSGMTIANAILNDNGGGIYNSGGTVNITNCVISGNGALSGGGIYLNSGAVTLRNSTVSGNFSTGGDGGGIRNNAGTLTVVNSTVSTNSANQSAAGNFVNGGGIANSGTTILTNTTVTGNTANDAGGGIYNGSTLIIVNNTIANNQANGLHSGGGIYSLGTASLKNSIVANNKICCGGTIPDLSGMFNSQDYNLIGNMAGATINATAHDILNQSGKLGALANNGGPTQTMLPNPGSVAIDAGDASNLPPDTYDVDDDGNTIEPLPFDQRGLARVINSKFDIGAVETNYAISVTAGNSQSTRIKTAFNTQLKVTVAESGNTKSGIPVTFTAPATGASGTFPGNALTVTINTDSSGVATAPNFTANGTAGAYNVVASLDASLPTIPFSLTNLTGDQTIAFGALSPKTFGDSDFSLTATASSGLAVSFTVTNGQCTIAGSTIHLTGAGACSVTASQNGDSNYNAATPIAQSFNIGKGSATIAFSNVTQYYDGTPKFVTTSTTPAGLSVTVTYSPVASPTNVGTYSVTATINDANYQGNATGTLVVAPYLVTDPANNNAIAIDSVTFASGPFSVLTTHNFSTDHHTRIMIFTSNLGLSAPDSNILTVLAGGMPLDVENVGTLSGVPNASYIIVRLPDGLGVGDSLLTISFHGVPSNSGVLSISP